jgi:4-amino-4-deoxy-L-arabinose transferase-like glycosyltransferase
MKYLLIAIVAAILFVPFLGHVHLFDWDEINFAEAAREMLVTKNYSQVQIDFQPFWEKPPLFIWMQALSMSLFGVNEFAARFPNAVAGIATLVILFGIGKRLADEKLGVWWALVYAGSWLPHFYFKSGIIDPTFNFFIFVAIYFASRIPFTVKPIRASMLSGVFLGLAVLTKGPVAILVSLLALIVYWIVKKGKTGIRIAQLGVIALSAFVITSLWFGYELIVHGWWFMEMFITYQVRLLTTPDAGHGGPFFYHWIVLLIGCFPASIFLFSYLRGRKERSIYTGAVSNEAKDFKVWMWVLFWVVLILFSVVQTKIVHYSSLCYFPLSFLAAWQVYRITEGKVVLRAWNIVLMLLVGLLLGTTIMLLPVAGVYKQQFISSIGDSFARANLGADIPFSLWDCAIGGGYILTIIVSAILLFNRKVQSGMVLLFVSTVIAIQITVVHFTPKIEGFSQRAAIEFCEELQGKDVYIQPLSLKSFIPLFYGKQLPHANKDYYKEGWLLRGKVDKPTYFIVRVNNAPFYKAIPELEVVKEKNGFVLFKRK